uniref:Uncharacterized protein n=1 Tax=Callithrix jacchus TaxID=9483 RepID=A0A8I3W8A3_CALJA
MAPRSGGGSPAAGGREPTLSATRRLQGAQLLDRGSRRGLGRLCQAGCVAGHPPCSAPGSLASRAAPQRQVPPARGDLWSRASAVFRLAQPPQPAELRMRRCLTTRISPGRGQSVPGLGQTDSPIGVGQGAGTEEGRGRAAGAGEGRAGGQQVAAAVERLSAAAVGGMSHPPSLIPLSRLVYTSNDSYEIHRRDLRKIHEAAWQGQDRKLPKMMKKRKTRDLNIRDAKNSTALMLAVCHGSSETVGMLLQQNVDIHAEDMCGMTAECYSVACAFDK